MAAPSASGEAKPSLEGRGEAGPAAGSTPEVRGAVSVRPACPGSFIISTGTEADETGPEGRETAGWAPEVRGAEGGGAGTGAGGGSVWASGATWRAPPVGTTLTPARGAPGRNGFSKLSRTLWGRLSAGLGPMPDISMLGSLKTALKASANSLAVWKRLRDVAVERAANQVVNAVGRSGR